ncbi:MAG: bifunctional folylpolyglutamate synthase/dihydrofolate synthase [Clostridia bacterium]|nr:bifunctional folylpolyglutamate synthase/dihydrofolate synthase [Clostridia bacterium]
MGNNEPEFLKDALKFGINLGLDRINALLNELGNPQKDIKAIHIAGTNGKGSTVAFLSSILAQSGLKVGIYTSPFLERFNERMRILDGKKNLDRFIEDDSTGEIPNSELKTYSDMVQLTADKLVKEGMEPPTEFELVTAIAFLWYRKENVDVVVLETGLGGRLDSTNVIDNPLCTLITAMGMDHSDRLGSTIGEITGEKAGIIKASCPALFLDPSVTLLLNSEEQKEVREVLINRAEELDAPYKFVCPDMNQKVTYDSNKMMTFTYDKNTYCTTLLGKHQIQNCAMAIECARLLKISEEDIREGVSKARWKSRAEVLSTKPLILMDGGHNPQGILSLGKVIEGLGLNKDSGKVNILIGAMKDKDMDRMLEIFKGIVGNVEFFYVTRVNNPRTFEPDELYNKIKFVYNRNDLMEDSTFEDAKEAAKAAIKESFISGTPLIILGSLYLAGEIRGYARELISEAAGENIDV